MDIPASHADLLDRPLPAALTTHFANGRLQSSVVWFWRGGGELRVSTMTEFVKARNLRERPRATLLVWDADGRWLELRSDVRELALTPHQAVAECDEVGFRYAGVRPYFGAMVPAEWADSEHPVTFRFAPVAVTAGPGVGEVHGATRSAADEPRAGARRRRRAVADTDREVPLPADHRNLLTSPSVRLLATTDSEGNARVRPVACRLVGERPVVAVDDEQAADLARDPRATLLVVDPGDTTRWMEIRADTSPAEDGGTTLLPRRVVLDAIHP